MDLSNENAIPKKTMRAGFGSLIEGNSMEHIKWGLAIAVGHIYTWEELANWWTLFYLN